jgi:hypothetical protein
VTQKPAARTKEQKFAATLALGGYVALAYGAMQTLWDVVPLIFFAEFGLLVVSFECDGWMGEGIGLG